MWCGLPVLYLGHFGEVFKLSLRRDRLPHSRPIHLIVLDLMLPGEDGLSICRRLRRPIKQPYPYYYGDCEREEVDRIVGLKLVLMITSQNHLTQNYSHVFALFFVVKQMNYRAHLHKITPLSLLVSSSWTLVHAKCSTKSICLWRAVNLLYWKYWYHTSWTTVSWQINEPCSWSRIQCYGAFNWCSNFSFTSHDWRRSNTPSLHSNGLGSWLLSLFLMEPALNEKAEALLTIN